MGATKVSANVSGRSSGALTKTPFAASQVTMPNQTRAPKRRFKWLEFMPACRNFGWDACYFAP
jgi:hypothetical protein